MSGGGVFDREGYLIGIHGQGRGFTINTEVRTGKSDLDPSKAENLEKYAWAIPSELFLSVLDNINVANTPSKEKIDISDRLNTLESQNEKLKKYLISTSQAIKSLQQNNIILNSWLFYLSSFLIVFLFISIY